MIYYSKIILTEEIDLAKRRNSKECIVYHCWYLLIKSEFKFQILVCNGCHDLLKLCHDINNTAIIATKGLFKSLFTVGKKK